jgi:hypothetical protein
MHIRAGYEIAFRTLQPTPIILMLTVHPTKTAGRQLVGATAMTNSNGIATTVLVLAIALSSVGGNHSAITAENGSLDGAGTGIASKNIIFDDNYALYADGMAAHYILLGLERAGYAKVLAMVADSSNTYSAPAMAAVNRTFGRANIPLGAYQGGISSGSSSSTCRRFALHDAGCLQRWVKGPSPERAATTRLRRIQTFPPSPCNGEVRHEAVLPV